MLLSLEGQEQPSQLSAGTRAAQYQLEEVCIVQLAIQCLPFAYSYLDLSMELEVIMIESAIGRVLSTVNSCLWCWRKQSTLVQAQNTSSGYMSRQCAAVWLTDCESRIDRDVVMAHTGSKVCRSNG